MEAAVYSRTALTVEGQCARALIGLCEKRQHDHFFDATDASQQTISPKIDFEVLSLPVDKAFSCSRILNQLMPGGSDNGIERGGASLRLTIPVGKLA